jgi:RNA 2',3'-cyclic 3'-phosphodiesterase
MELNRLFLGIEVGLPWPEVWPEGRRIEEPYRHVTVDFLADRSITLLKIGPMIGTCGFFDKSVFLNSRCVSWHVHWLNQDMDQIQQQISNKPWIPQLTICRKPFHWEEWKNFFRPLPCFAKALKLYKSIGYSHYETLWKHELIPPFEEIEHTADVAFQIYGKDLNNLYENAFTALAFKHPLLVTLWENKSFRTLDEIIIELNRIVQKADSMSGCPFKAVSFHGEIQRFEETFIQWEMIIDV